MHEHPSIRMTPIEALLLALALMPLWAPFALIALAMVLGSPD
jgi:hypothetical protein